MTRQLALDASHRESADAFSIVWNHRLPAGFNREPAEEYAAVRGAVGLFDQSYRGVLDLVGDSVDGFLQRLVSTHATGLSRRSGQESALLSARGRLLGAFQLHRVGEERFRMVLGEPLRDGLVSALRRYAFLDDIELDDREQELVVLALAGPRSVDALDGGRLPGERLERVAGSLADVDVEIVRASETDEDGFEIWAPRAQAAAVWAALLGRVERLGGLRVGWRAAESLRVEAGLTRYEIDYDDDGFPSEVNHGHRLTYDKCYVGQEVVARMQTYGHVNRKAFHLAPDGESELASGERIVAGDDDAGHVTSVCDAFRAHAPRGIGMVHRKYWESGELCTERGTRIALSELPEQKGIAR